jgi:hypothetical protein
MIVLSPFFQVNIYFITSDSPFGNKKNIGARKWRWLNELKQEREKDIDVEMIKGRRKTV